MSQPIRAEEPGSASSTASMAEKCDRLGTRIPVAWTAASLPAFHIGSSGSREGWSPKVASAASKEAAGIAMVGRAA